MFTKIKCMTTVVSCLAAVFAWGGTINEASFQRKMLVTFSGCGVGEHDPSLDNFPALVELDPARLAGFHYSDFTSPEDGADLRFADASGNELNYEIDTWNTNGVSLVWVQVPAMRSDAVVTAYWGGSDTTAPAYRTNGATWSNGYVAVWHLNEAVLPLRDSAGRSNHFENASAETSKFDLGASDSLLKLGKHVRLKGGDCRISTPNNPDIPAMTAMTLEMMLLEQTGNGDTVGLLAKRSGNDVSCAFMLSKVSSKMSFDAVNGTSVPRFTLVTIPTKDAWAHHAVVSDSAAPAGQRVRYYQDATLKSTPDTGTHPGSISHTTAPVVIGTFHIGDTRGWSGRLDEVRISSVARSVAWIAASRKTMATPQNFATYGSVTEIDASAPIVVTYDPLISNASVALCGELLNSGGSATTVTTYFGEHDGETIAANWDMPLAAVIESDGGITNILALGTDLAYGAKYYYRHHAVNAATDSWAARTIMFTTPGPAILGTPTSVSSPSSFDASVELIDIGAAAATVSCWVGTDPGQLAIAETWENLDTPQTVTHTQSGISPGSRYYYAFRAVNAMPDGSGDKTAWTATNSVITSGNITWTGAGATTDWTDAANWDYGVPNEYVGARFLAPAEAVTAGGAALNATNLVFKFTGALNMNLNGATLAVPGGMNVGSSSSVALALQGGAIDLASGALMIGDHGNDNVVSITGGARLNTGKITLGYIAQRNHLVVGDGGTLTASGTTVISDRTGDVQSQGNEFQVLRGGSFIASGIQIGPSAGSSENATGRMLIDGGAVTNTGSLLLSNSFGTNHGLILRNGATLKNNGNLTISQRAKGCHVHVLDGSTADITGSIKLNDFGDNAGNTASLIVSNAQVSAQHLTVGHNYVGRDNTIRLIENPGRHAEIRLSGTLELSRSSTGNKLYVDGGLLSATAINTATASASASNSLISVTGPTARLRPGSMNLKYHTTLAFTIPDEGFTETPIHTTGAITLDGTTRVEINSAKFTGKAVLLQGSSVTSVPDERITLNLHPDYKATLLRTPDSLAVHISRTTTLFFLR